MSKPERFEDFYQRLRDFQMGQFAQRVSPMQPVEQSDAVQVVLMESWLNDELKCECVHQATPCSVSVTHRVIACDTGVNLCANAAKVREAWMADPGNCCKGCRLPLPDCWRLVPV